LGYPVARRMKELPRTVEADAFLMHCEPESLSNLTD
jgi:hypothetical protein